MCSFEHISKINDKIRRRLRMHITLEADYAIRTVFYLLTADKRQDAKSISEQTGVTLRFSLKILRKLVISGIAVSFKGTRGGYEIAKKPEEISLREVIEAVDGPYSISRCLSGDYICSKVHKNPCKVKEAFEDISNIVRSKLEDMTFDKLIF